MGCVAVSKIWNADEDQFLQNKMQATVKGEKRQKSPLILLEMIAGAWWQRTVQPVFSKAFSKNTGPMWCASREGFHFPKYVCKSLQAPLPAPRPPCFRERTSFTLKALRSPVGKKLTWLWSAKHFSSLYVPRAFCSPSPQSLISPLEAFFEAGTLGGCREQSWMCLRSQCGGVKSLLWTCPLDQSTLHLHLLKPGYGSSVAGNSRTPPFHGHKKRRAPTLLFSRTAWCKQSKVSEAGFLPDTTLSLRIPMEGGFPGSFPKRWHLICLLLQRFLSDVLAVWWDRPGQCFPKPPLYGGWNDWKIPPIGNLSTFQCKILFLLKWWKCSEVQQQGLPPHMDMAVSISYSSPSLIPRTIVQSIRGQWALGKLVGGET